MSEVPAFQRRALVANIRSQLTSALQGLGRSDVDLPQTLVYEDGALDPATLELPMDKWRNHLEDLSDLQSLCPVLETNTSVRLVMKGFFKAVYGKGEECQDVLSFCEVFRNDYYEQYQQASWMSMIRSQGERASINHFNVPELDLLDDARRRLSDGVKTCHE